MVFTIFSLFSAKNSCLVQRNHLPTLPSWYFSVVSWLRCRLRGPPPVQPGGQLVDNSALEEDLSVAVAAVVEARVGKRLKWLKRPAWEKLPREELGQLHG